MALINQRTGYYGFTLDGLDGIKSDITGSVKKCIISIAYQLRLRNVIFTISNGAEDWGAQMGDGSIIPLSNPKVLYVNRDNAIVEFDMAEAYAANSPCVLVYRSDSALFSIKETDEERPFTENTLSGHFAFTTEGYGGKSYDNGYVDRVLCTFPFPTQISDIEFSISNGDDHWGARMGDGSIINLKNPQVIVTNKDNAVIVFEMETSYPSNSPCIIVYRSSNANYSIKVTTKPEEFVPVQDIIDVPQYVTAGTTVDLSPCSILPTNATYQGIVWNVVSGNATVNGDRLSILGSGDIVLNGTIISGSSEDGEDFSKDFNIKVNQNVITIVAQPAEKVSMTHGSIDGFISVNAESSNGVISYKWYRNTINSTAGAIQLGGGNKDKYIFPADIQIGKYFYFCEISSPGASTVRTNMCEVTIFKELQGIRIYPKINSLNYHERSKLSVSPIPEEGFVNLISWSSSNIEIIQVDKDGNLYAVGPGSAIITAKTPDERFSDTVTISVADHIPVQDINNVIVNMDTDTDYILSGDVVPSNATNKDIKWSIVDAGDTGAIIDNGKISATNVGNIIIRATIENGASIISDYVKDIVVKIDYKFTPVTNILVDIPGYITIQDILVLSPTIVPSNATNKDIKWSIVDAGDTGAVINNGILTFTNDGKCTIKGIIVNGLSKSQDFVKNFEITISPNFIKVENILNFPERLEDVSKPLKVSGTVYPSNSTNKDIIYTLEDYPRELVVRFVDNTIYIDNYETATWWVENENPTPPYFEDKWLENITQPIVINAIVPNGNGIGEDFVKRMEIGIQHPESPEIHIPIESIHLELPSIVRARRPLLMARVNKEPWTATNGQIILGFVRADTRQGGFAYSFIPSEESADYWKENYNITLTDEYDWNREGYYVCIFEDIDMIITYHVENGNADKTSYNNEEIVKVLPEYIPIKNIKNIPIELPYNSSTQLCAEFDTNFNITKVNTEVYDVDIPSYTEVLWTVIDQGRTGARINNDILTFTGTGTAIIEAEVINGKKEEFTWYGTENKGESYKQRFTIDVTGSEREYNMPIAKLTLDNNDVVNIYKVSDLYNLSNDKPSDSYISAGGSRFRKNQVKSIEFWDSNIYVDDHVYVDDIVFNDKSINTYNPAKPVQETSSFSNVSPSSDPDGCTIITDTNSEFNNMYTLPEGAFIHFDGTIIKYIDKSDGQEDLILNAKYASSIFLIDPKYINLPNGFVRYDNGWVSIPKGTILNQNGNLIIPNPEYVKGDYTVSSKLYEISIYGVVFDYVNSKTIMPDGSEIRSNGIIKLPSGYLYDHSSVSFTNSSQSSDINFPIAYGSYINSNNEICLVENIKSNISNLEYIRNDSGSFIKLSGESFIYENGFIYSEDKGLFDVYGNKITQYIDLTSRSNVSPSTATNKNIGWDIESGPNGSKIIIIPISGRDKYLLVPGNKSGQLVLNGYVNITNNISEFDKKFLINIGTVSNVESKILGINTNMSFKNIYKGYSRTTVNLSATLLGTDQDIVNSSSGNITWELEGNSSSRTNISVSDNRMSATLSISSRESINNTLTVTIKCGNVEKNISIRINSQFNQSEPYVESLSNFARNFSNLTYINKIPLTVNGDDCLRNFLMGCTSFNQRIDIPSYIEGDRCLKGFLSGCTSFNQPLTIPDNVTGSECLERFLAGCTSFNQNIDIPEGVSGYKCMHRFLEHCTSFNKTINLPSNVSGKQCLDHFLNGCISFNKPITIPDGISGVASMRAFMKDTLKMTSNITISLEAANNCEINGLTLACFTRDDAYDVGVPVVGEGAEVFKEKCVNMVMLIPLRRLI